MEDFFAARPLETDGHYNAFVEYLETKDSPKAKRLLEKLKALKDTDEFYYFREKLLWDVFIEIS